MPRGLPECDGIKGAHDAFQRIGLRSLRRHLIDSTDARLGAGSVPILLQILRFAIVGAQFQALGQLGNAALV